MIFAKRIETVLGIMTACSVEEGICLLEFSDRKIQARDFRFLEKTFNSEILEADYSHLISLKDQLDEYFRGVRKKFSLPLVTPGSAFQNSVWKELGNIEYGTTRTYLQQSAALGIPGSVRAVANANGMNRIAIIIPCHRVIGSEGRLTGYAGGLERKKWLLDHEKKHSGKAYDLKIF